MVRPCLPACSTQLFLQRVWLLPGAPPGKGAQFFLLPDPETRLMPSSYQAEEKLLSLRDHPLSLGLPDPLGCTVFSMCFCTEILSIPP